MMTHTPGNYLVAGTTVYALDISESVNRFSALVQGGYTLHTHNGGGDRTTAEELAATAILFGAAPDLLEALREAKGLADMAVMSDDLDGTPSDDQASLIRLRAKIDAALAKALPQ